MRIAVLVLILSIFSGCIDSETPTNKRTDQVETKNEDDQFELLPEADKENRLARERRNADKRHQNLLESCFLKNPDSSVAGIVIDDIKSTIKVLGEGVKLGGDRTYRNLNESKSQFLNLTVYPGSYYNQISVFEVGYSHDVRKSDRFLDKADFSTEKGVKLGMDQSELIKIFGDCYKVRLKTADSFNISYRIEAPQDTKSNYLAKHRMPVYYAEYDFQKGKLNRFEFGFEYP